MKIKKGFTLIELLVTTTVILLLTSIAIVSYASASKRSRDNKRISDLETVRSALEIYRSENGLYPVVSSFSNMVTELTGFINQAPSDPKTGNSYYYSSSDGSTYTLCAYIESTDLQGSCTGNPSCGTSGACNYQLSPP